MCGLSGAGKDSCIKAHYNDWPIISLDGIRNEKGILPTDRAGNGRVMQEAKERARVFLRKQQSFVWKESR